MTSWRKRSLTFFWFDQEIDINFTCVVEDGENVALDDDKLHDGTIINQHLDKIYKHLK